MMSTQEAPTAEVTAAVVATSDNVEIEQADTKPPTDQRELGTAAIGHHHDDILTPSHQETANATTLSGGDTLTSATTSQLTTSSPTRGSPRTSDGGMSRPIRVPGTFPPEWLPDHEADSCMSCVSPFTLIKRRHHCRSCGKIFCSDCCKQKARLLYMDNKEARVCNNCHQLIEFTLSNPSEVIGVSLEQQQQRSLRTSHDEQFASSSSGGVASSRASGSSVIRVVQGVLKTSNQAARAASSSNETRSNTSNSLSDQQAANKQVIFSDGIRPGTDLSEPAPGQSSATSSSGCGVNDPTDDPSSHSMLSRQQSKKSDAKYSNRSSSITVCDELGYLPPIVISKEATIANDSSNSTSNPLTNLIVSHFKSTRKAIQASMESRNCPLNGIVKFEEISDLVGVDNVITFLLLRGFHLKVKIIKKDCCLNRTRSKVLDGGGDINNETDNQEDFADRSLSCELQAAEEGSTSQEYWCFTSSGLDKLGQDEIVFVLDKDKENSCIPRDIFKIYLTLHELALRRQAIENLGNLLFQDGLFGSRDTAGLLFVQPTADHCLKNLILPEKKFLVALVLQRWEVPWSKVFPMRLLLRLGHKYDTYPYPIVSFKNRDPVYYEIGHTIISILGDFRNFRYALTHVEGLRVMLNKTTRQVTVQLQQSSYAQFSKVLDSSNNEHVLAWSSGPFPEADGHLVSVQTDDGQYESVEFYKKKSQNQNISFKNLESGPVLGSSFIVFSGALKVNQTGQPAKISIVEDGLLIQIQSCTMSALRNAIHYMDNFDIDCENKQDMLNQVEIRWA